MKRVLVVSVVVLLLFGCAHPSSNVAVNSIVITGNQVLFDPSGVAKVHKGSSRDEVKSAWGEPYQATTNEGHEHLIYRAVTAQAIEGKPSREGYTVHKFATFQLTIADGIVSEIHSLEAIVEFPPDTQFK